MTSPAFSAPSSDDFDFDAWRHLAEQDPQAFFARRQEAIAAFIASHPTEEGRAQLQQTQDQIDGLRLTAASPDRALQGIASLLSDHLDALTSHLTDLGEQASHLSGLLQRVQRAA